MTRMDISREKTGPRLLTFCGQHFPLSKGYPSWSQELRRIINFRPYYQLPPRITNFHLVLPTFHLFVPERWSLKNFNSHWVHGLVAERRIESLQHDCWLLYERGKGAEEKACQVRISSHWIYSANMDTFQKTELSYRISYNYTIHNEKD